MRQETREALELFVEKADELVSLSFGDSAQKIGFRYSMKVGEPQELEIKGPNQEQVAAFVLTFRFFIQEREPSSFRWLGKKVLDDPGLSNEWKDAFNDVRAEMNRFRFEALDALEEAGYLNQTKRAKSVTITEAGIERARTLAAKYLGDAAKGI